jgi:lysophospholipase L1-like esterase
VNARCEHLGRWLTLALVALIPAFDASAQARFAGQPVDAWGDSLTSGTPGIGGLPGTWPYQLSALLDGRVVRNFGVSGQTSDAIAAREGALQPLLRVAGNLLPAEGTVAVTVTNNVGIPGVGLGEVHGTLNGTPGKLAYTPDYHHVFIRDTGGAPVRVPADSPFLVDDHREDINVFWAGRNDVNLSQTSETMKNIERMAAHVGHERFIILGILNGAGEGRGTAKYATVMSLNRQLATRFPSNFIDVRAALVANANQTAMDQADRASDVVPGSLRVDSQHLSADGYRIVAQQVAQVIRRHGW